MTDASAPSTPPPARRPSTASLLLMLVVTSAAIGWYAYTHRSVPAPPTPSAATPPPAVVEPDPEWRKRLERLETSLSDLERVNSVLRQQVVALTERTRVQGEQLELQSRQQGARAATEGRGQSALLRADLWLNLAQARQDLYADSGGALSALREADQALAASQDSRIPALRQTLAIELEALRRDPLLDGHRIAGQLDAWKQALPGWPLRQPQDATEAGSGILQRLDRYFQVRPIAEAVADTGEEQLLQAELAWSRVLLARGERAALLASLQRISVTIDARYDPDHAAVHAALEGIETLVEQLRSSASGPALGSTLQELRALLGLAPASAQSAADTAGATVEPALPAELPTPTTSPIHPDLESEQRPAPEPSAPAADEPASGATPP